MTIFEGLVAFGWALHRPWRISLSQCAAVMARAMLYACLIGAWREH